jgi:2,3-diaminopropionate biosynthesis protein SbnA
MNYQAMADMSPRELLHVVAQIGNTPLRPLWMDIEGVSHRVSLKLEGENPGGSVKDRTGLALIQNLERRSLLDHQSIIIESTSGNLGVALSLICRVKGYQFLAVIDPKTTPENIEKMQTLGASIDLVSQADETGSYLLSRLARVRELSQLSSKYVWTNQYSNPANPEIHFTQTGAEIYRQMHGKVGAIFVAVSTGGTLAGIGQYFRKMSPATRVIGVDAVGSVIFGTPPSARRLTGIGSSKPSDFVTLDHYDQYQLVSDAEAFAFCRAVYAATDLKLGGSSGAVLAACASYLAAYPQVENVVCLCPDTGENYATTIFHDLWLEEQKLVLSRDHLGPVQKIRP